MNSILSKYVNVLKITHLRAMLFGNFHLRGRKTRRKRRWSNIPCFHLHRYLFAIKI
ncbi:unnamed protein product [Haemonchus placei]|uniref:Uncharacterized protein n=1 Tax=Haemonchus placei TaxID=6290 RepID=A0A0N4VZ24_HAEPC|nr:unnamed protein product [Haemonchus placei]